MRSPSTAVSQGKLGKRLAVEVSQDTGEDLHRLHVLGPGAAHAQQEKVMARSSRSRGRFCFEAADIVQGQRPAQPLQLDFAD